MSSRRPPRAGAGITGPQSALTDFLKTHNISASRIREDYEARLAQAQAQADADALEAGPSNAPHTIEEEDVDASMQDVEEELETPQQARKRKRQEQATIQKIKKSKEFAKKKAAMKGEPGEDDDDDLAFDMLDSFVSRAKVPGQMENCEKCEKRFTVTPYTKEGPNGGLLCTKCGKIQEDAKKKLAKSKKAPAPRGKRQTTQSNLMDGHAPQGSKTLFETCVERIAKSIDDIEDFGDLPPNLYDRLSMILCKRRVLDSRTLDLFLFPENDRVAIYDCAKLKTDDFIRIFQICPNVKTIDLRHAGQFKDKVLDFILERKIHLQHLRLNAPNLITDDKWQEFFTKAGSYLESLQLSHLDFAMTNPSIGVMAKHCKNLKRLKLKVCFHLDDEALQMLGKLTKLEHLSLTWRTPASPKVIADLVEKVGASLQSLCLRDFVDANNDLINAVKKCDSLKKLVIMRNDRITDDAFADLFTDWANPPLEQALFTACRETDRPDDRQANEETDEEGDEESQEKPVTGLSSKGFTALMNHSGSGLQKLNISSCRTISHEALFDAFDGAKIYSNLVEIDVSFVAGIDTTIVMGIFKSCPSLKKLVAFGCFDIGEIRIPVGVALIGIPGIEGMVQEGFVDDMDLD